MKIEARFLVGVAIFFAIVAVGYWFWSSEQSGTAMLAGSFLLGLVPGSYYLWWSRRMKPRPEDRDDATLADGAGVIGTFPGSTIWPFVMGMGLFFAALSAVFGFWLLAPGFAAVFLAAIGYTVESRRGGRV
jgi:multisubunit Na+/H+ antiporter MnhG subunit